MLPFAKNLEWMGITARVRTVDNAQYQKRMETFDYDMAVVAFGELLSPGNEQREYWGSQSADEQGSRNLMGVKSKVVDELIEELVRAPDRASLVAHTHALDRVLQYGYYLIPHYHIAAFRVAHWDKFRRPTVPRRTRSDSIPGGSIPPPSSGRSQERRSDEAVTRGPEQAPAATLPRGHGGGRDPRRREGGGRHQPEFTL